MRDDTVNIDRALEILHGTTPLAEERDALEFIPYERYNSAFRARDRIRNRFNDEWWRCRACNGPITRKVKRHQRHCRACIEARKSRPRRRPRDTSA